MSLPGVLGGSAPAVTGALARSVIVTDPSPGTVRAYAEVRRRLETTAFVPVHNESVSVMYEKTDFPPSRNEYGLIRIPRLSAIVRGVVDRPSFSFGAYMT